jgi:hypothetical protein
LGDGDCREGFWKVRYSIAIKELRAMRTSYEKAGITTYQGYYRLVKKLPMNSAMPNIKGHTPPEETEAYDLLCLYKWESEVPEE